MPSKVFGLVAIAFFITLAKAARNQGLRKAILRTDSTSSSSFFAALLINELARRIDLALEIWIADGLLCDEIHSMPEQSLQPDPGALPLAIAFHAFSVKNVTARSAGGRK